MLTLTLTLISTAMVIIASLMLGVIVDIAVNGVGSDINE